MPDDDRPAVTVEVVRNGPAQTRVTRMTTEAATGRPFVLVAGVGVAAAYFEFLAPLLAVEGDVYALDLPGFAGVPASGEQPTAAFFADQVDAVIARYDLRDPVLLGHSMGTQIVTEVLARHDDLSHAVLVSPVVDEDEAHVVTQAVRFAQSTFRESLHVTLTAFSAYLLCGMVYFLEVLPHLLRYRISDRIELATARVLFIRGEHDRPSPRRLHSRLVERARDARRWEIEGAAHAVINGHAVGVARLVVRHVHDQLPARGRLSEAASLVPPARHADVRMMARAASIRFAEWVSALRHDESGVARAKVRHSRLLWRAYRPRR